MNQNIDWHNYYNKPISFYDYFGNIFSHKTLIMSILKERPKRVLEIGSGTGTLSVFLSYFVKKVISIDNNKKVLESCARNNNKFKGNVVFADGDTFNIELRDNSFDVVYSQGLLEHFSKEDIIKILDEQLRVGKVVIISVPNNYRISEGAGKEVRWSKKEWENFLSKYYLLESRNYGRAIMKFCLNKPDQYLAKLCLLFKHKEKQ